ncbi:MAG: TRAP transporter small permease [Pseudomonadota bacterium]
MYWTVGQRAVWALARIMALLGGIVLTGLILLTCVSVVGRGLNGFLNDHVAQTVMPDFADWALAQGIGPVLGDVELVEAGMAFVIFAFLPLCQLSGAHARVDIFTQRLPLGVRRWLAAVTDVVFAVVLVLIAWRLSVGLAEKRHYVETTFMLQLPVWWAYTASLAAAAIAGFAGVFVALARLVEAMKGGDVIDPDGDMAG